MQPQTLTKALRQLRSMVEKEGDTYSILAYIDSFAIRVKSAEKSHHNTQTQLEQLTSIQKQLKQKAKNVQKMLSKKEKQCESLHNELKRMASICHNKTQKLIKAEDQHQSTNLQRVASQKRDVDLRSEGSQCQFLNQFLIKELKDENYKLQNKLKNLQKIYEEQLNQNSAKELYIRELLQTLQSRMMRHHTDYEDDDQAQQLLKQGDNSTIDAQSLKGDQQTGQQLAQVKGDYQIQLTQNPETASCQTHTVTDGKSWLSAIWWNSIRFYQKILRR